MNRKRSTAIGIGAVCIAIGFGGCIIVEEGCESEKEIMELEYVDQVAGEVVDAGSEIEQWQGDKILLCTGVYLDIYKEVDSTVPTRIKMEEIIE